MAAGVTVLALFVLVERGRQDREPLLPFGIVRNRNFSLMGGGGGDTSARTGRDAVPYSAAPAGGGRHERAMPG